MEGPRTATTPWEAADYIETPNDVVEFLKAALEENDPALLTEALKVIARAKGMASIAKRGQRPEERISSQSDSELTTLLWIIEAMDLRSEARAEQDDPVLVAG